MNSPENPNHNPGGENPNSPPQNTGNDESTKYGYTINIHYENLTGEAPPDSLTGSGKLNSQIPWEAEKLIQLTKNGDNYMLVGFSSTNYITPDTDKNIADLYYMIDENQDEIPDKWTASKDSLYDYVATFDYDNGSYLEQKILRNAPIGTCAVASINTVKVLGKGDDAMSYSYNGIDAKSVFVLPPWLITTLPRFTICPAQMRNFLHNPRSQIPTNATVTILIANVCLIMTALTNRAAIAASRRTSIIPSSQAILSFLPNPAIPVNRFPMDTKQSGLAYLGSRLELDRISWKYSQRQTQHTPQQK